MQVQPIKPYNSLQNRPSFGVGVSRYVVENLGLELQQLAKKADTKTAKNSVVELGHKILDKLAEIRGWDNESTRISTRLSKSPNSLTKHYVHSRFDWVIELIRPRTDYIDGILPHQINMISEPILKTGEEIDKTGVIQSLLGLKKEDIITAKTALIRKAAKYKAGITTGDIEVTEKTKYNPSLAQIIAENAEEILGKDSYSEYQKTLKTLLKDYKPTFDQRIDEFFKSKQSSSDGLVILSNLRKVFAQIIKAAVKDNEISETEALELSQKFQSKINKMSTWKELKDMPLDWKPGMSGTDLSTGITREFSPSCVGLPIREYRWSGPSLFPEYIPVATFSKMTRTGTLLQDVTKKILSLTKEDVLAAIEKTGRGKALRKSVKDSKVYEQGRFLANNPPSPKLYKGSDIRKIEANMYDFLQPEERIAFGG